MLEEVEGCTAKTAICSKIRKIGESSVRGGRRVPSKNCSFCDLWDFSENCEKLEKSQFLLKLTKSSIRGGRRVPSKNCDFSKNYEKLEKSQFLLKLTSHLFEEWKSAQQKLRLLQFLRCLQKLRKFGEIAFFLLKLLNSSGKGGRRAPSKNCDFCNFSTNCEKLEKLQVLLILLNSSGKGGRRAPSKNCGYRNFSTNCEKLEKLQFLLILLNSSGEGGRRAPSKNCDFCDFSKNCEKLGKSQNNYVKITKYSRGKGAEGYATKPEISEGKVDYYKVLNILLCYLQNDDLSSKQFCKDQLDQVSHHL